MERRTNSRLDLLPSIASSRAFVPRVFPRFERELRRGTMKHDWESTGARGNDASGALRAGFRRGGKTRSTVRASGESEAARKVGPSHATGADSGWLGGAVSQALQARWGAASLAGSGLPPTCR